MDIDFRAGRPGDAATLGSIAYRAFKSIADKHNFPPDFPSTEVATAMLSSLLTNPQFYSVVAASERRAIGSNFMDERAIIGGIGPISVDPDVQDRGVGKQLMLQALERVRERAMPGVRLLQSAYHMRSLSLYTKLGFDTRETISVMFGEPLNLDSAQFRVRAAVKGDLDECNRLCEYVHGFDRGGELAETINHGAAYVVESGGHIAGYSTGVSFGGHTVAESDDAICAIIGATREFHEPGFLVPSRNGKVMRWCLERGFRIVFQMTLMTIGMYNEPRGAYLPSVLF
jgi:predicted N-acetyltransferase YhbS